MSERVTVWKVDNEYHVVKASDPERELIYPMHTAKRFYLDVVQKLVEGAEEVKA